MWWFVIRLCMYIIGFLFLNEIYVILVLFGDYDGEMIGLLFVNVICGLVLFELEICSWKWWLILDIYDRCVVKILCLLISF